MALPAILAVVTGPHCMTPWSMTLGSFPCHPTYMDMWHGFRPSQPLLLNLTLTAVF